MLLLLCLTCHATLTPDPELFLTPCCLKPICPTCLLRNPRLSTYCPMCQLGLPLALPPYENEPPQYESNFSDNKKNIYDDAKKEKIATDCAVHFVRSKDTVIGLAFQYGIEISTLRKANRLFRDEELAARTAIIIPGYTGPSFSSSPPPEDEIKNAIKRFQIRSKCIDYNEAVIYMEQSGYNVDIAVKNYEEDLRWEQANPYGVVGRSKRGRGRSGRY